MRDQRELALQCLEVEDAGGSVIEFLKTDRTDKCFDHWFCVGADYNIFQ
jgi:hypothetical protein